MSLEKLDTEIRREQIVLAALNVAASEGMQGLKVSELAHRVGIVPSAVYRHFKGKSEILDALLDLIEERILENVKIVCTESDDAFERLRNLLLRHVQLIMDYQAIPRIIFSEEVIGGRAERKSKICRILRKYLDEVASIVRRGQEEGVIRSDVSPDTAALAFIGLFQPAAFFWHLTDGDFDVKGQAENAWRIYGDGMRKK
jgi:AcrR family transcriptional regulator